MAIAYHVFSGKIGSKTTIDNIKDAGAKKSNEITIKNRHAWAYRFEGPNSPICAVVIYEAKGDNFKGAKI